MLLLPMFTDWLSIAGLYLICREESLSASLVAKLFFDNVVRFFGVPTEVISERDPRFTAFFWWELWACLGPSF